MKKGRAPTAPSTKWRSQTVVRIAEVMGKCRVREDLPRPKGTAEQLAEYRTPARFLLLSCGHERTTGRLGQVYRVGDRCACRECRLDQWLLRDRYCPSAVFVRPRGELAQWRALFPAGEYDDAATVSPIAGFPACRGRLRARDGKRSRGRLVVWFIEEGKGNGQPRTDSAPGTGRPHPRGE